MRFAERATGLSNWGSQDFIHRLALWLSSITSDRGLNSSGRAEVEAWTLRHACNRLRLERLIEQHPEILETEIREPVVVTGLPRSATTALASRLTVERDLRFLPVWQSLEPFSGEEQAKRRRATRQRDLLVKICPDLPRLHDCRADAFVDDTELQCLAFGSYALEWHCHAPAWRDACLSEDQEPVYRYLKRALQALSFLGNDDRRWIIKSPQHMEQLPTLAKVFPDAELIVSQRPRRSVDRSMDKVVKAMDRAFRLRAFPQTYWKQRFDAMLQRYEASKNIFEGRRELHAGSWS
jgi:hypothetical protein